VEEVKKRFWDLWKKQVFQGLLLDAKWRKIQSNVKVGDIVMMLENEFGDASHRLARIVKGKRHPLHYLHLDLSVVFGNRDRKD